MATVCVQYVALEVEAAIEGGVFRMPGKRHVSVSRAATTPPGRQTRRISISAATGSAR
jgi:hypothetical protein